MRFLDKYSDLRYFVVFSENIIQILLVFASNNKKNLPMG